MTSLLRLVVAALSACALGQAQAATVCRLASGGSLSFGNYDILSTTPNDTLVSIDVQCDRDGGPGSVSVVLGLGSGTIGASTNARRLGRVGGGDVLAYGLYRDTGRSLVWGGSPNVDTVARTLSIPNKGSATTTFTVYGRIPPGQDVRAGSYSDTIQVTVTP